MSAKSRKSTVVFFVIAFGIPWLVWTLTRFMDTSDTVKAALVYIGGFCSLGGFAAAFVARGGDGISMMLRRIVDFKFPKMWWIIAVTIPFFYMTIAYVWGKFSDIGALQEIEPAKILLIFSSPALMMLLTGPVSEEFGWRGFLLPKLLEKFTPLTASIVLGLIWGFWYFPVYANNIFGSFYSGFVFIVHTVFMATIMTVIFLNTRGNLLIAIVYHWLANVVQLAFIPSFANARSSFDAFQNVGELIVIGILFVFYRKKMLEKYDGELLFLNDHPIPLATATGGP